MLKRLAAAVFVVVAAVYMAGSRRRGMRVTDSPQEVVVIGSGMSGLVAATALARAGHQVTVLEQYDGIGGVTATVRQDGFGWDIGPLMVESWPLWHVLEAIGLPASTVKLNTVRGHRVQVLPDFTLLPPDEYTPTWRSDQLKKQFPAEAENIDRYDVEVAAPVQRLVELDRLVNYGEGVGVVGTVKAYIEMAVSYWKIRKMVPWSAKQLMDHYFSDRKLKAVYAGILADFGTRPSDFVALGLPFLNPLGHYDPRTATNSFGAHVHVQGGMETLVASVADAFKAAGGTIQTQALVTGIDIDPKTRKVTSVRVKDKTNDKKDEERVVPASIVVASGAARDVFFGLVGRQHLPDDFVERVDALKVMDSVLMVLLGVKGKLGEYVSKHPLTYYYQMYDIEGAVDEMQAGKYHEGKRGFLIYVGSEVGPGLAPSNDDMHSVTIYTVAPTRLADGHAWADVKEEMADKLIAQAAKRLPALQDPHSIVTRVVLTPEDYEVRTAQSRHAFGGVCPIVGQDALPVDVPGVEGLFFTGAQQEIGGVAQVMMSGLKAAQAAIDKVD